MSSPRSAGPDADHPQPGATRTEQTRRRRPWWLWALLAVVVLAILLLSLIRCGGSDTDNTAAAPSAAPSAAPAPDGAGAGTGAGAGSPTDPAGPPANTDGGTGRDVLTADGAALLPLPANNGSGSGSALAAQAGKTATARGALVQSVPADEGFWVGTDETNRVWVQLSGTGESTYVVKQGDRVDFTGKIAAQTPGYAGTVGVDAAEGAAQLDQQGAHIEVAKRDLRQSAA